jgi:hypothetical protein
MTTGWLTTIAAAAALLAAAGAAVAQNTPVAPAEPTLPENPIPDIISPEPIAPGVPAPEPTEDQDAGEALPNVPGTEAPATPDVSLPPAATNMDAGDATGSGGVVMMPEEEMQGFIRGQTYQGMDPATGNVVATVQYGLDGTSVLTLPDGTEENGVYRFEGASYCTRYEDFRDGSENCFTLQDLGDGRVQAWYTDGRRALILAPAT